jgi:small neutral amino acid transporter SnatA (MarC family)
VGSAPSSAATQFALLAFSSLPGLVTAVIGVQFILNGVTTVLTAIIREARSAP